MASPIPPALISGSASGAISLWDLEQTSRRPYRPITTIPRSASAHRFGITHLSFYPFDPLAFLSSSYDTTLKLWSTETASASGSFSLQAKIYTHAASPIASHLLVACGTQHPAVRWDIRRTSIPLTLDLEDHLGPQHSSNAHLNRPPRASAKAHTGPVNGLAWTDDGEWIVSAGHDHKIRVWSSATGGNSLVDFGASVRNEVVGTVSMVVSPTGITKKQGEVVFLASGNEILVGELHEGQVLGRLKAGGGVVNVASGSGERSQRNRVTSVVWRGAGGGGGSSGPVMGGTDAPGGIYSGHLDGHIRAWIPKLDGTDDEDVIETEDVDTRKRKRKALDDAFRNLMGRQVTFT
ncbi:hypothetical protein OQA88_10481 [Cercophora sp. LCS_1]